FAEGEDGVPYSYDKKVESRLTAIENKLDSVIENGSVNTQLTGSNIEKVLEQDFTVSANSVKFIEVNLMNIVEFSVAIQDVSSADKKSEVMIRWLSQSGGWLDGTAASLIPVTNHENRISDSTKAKSVKALLYIYNRSTTESMTVGKVYIFPKGG